MRLLTVLIIALASTLSNGQFGFNLGSLPKVHIPSVPKVPDVLNPLALDLKFLSFPQGSEFLGWLSKNKAGTWEIGQNFLQSTPLAFLKTLGGSVVRKPYDSLQGFTTLTDTKPESFKLPENFDARVKWPKCPSIKEISNQRSCGSCWAVAAADVMSDRACILSEGKEPSRRYSTQDLLTCCTDCGAGCDGGDPFVAYDYWITNGIVSGGYESALQGCLQYNIPACRQDIANSSEPVCDTENVVTPKCQKTCESGYKIPYQSDLKQGDKAYNITTVDDAMYELVTKGPINAIMQVYPDFFSYKTGIYQVTNGTESIGGHAIRIIGYGQENGVPYWLGANSWNASWGDNGLFKVLRGKNEAGIEEFLLGGLPKLL